MESLNCLAFDLGAPSGRLMLGSFDGEKIALSEIHRFENETVRMNGVMYWDIFRLVADIKLGLKKASALGLRLDSVGIDTWGVDYGLLDSNNNLIGTPIAYRDTRTDNCIAEAQTKIPLEEIYKSTGIQFLNFNTLFQMMADIKMRPAAYNAAECMLFIPDLLGFALSGEKYNEYTAISTGQLLNAESKKIDFEIMKKLGLRTDLFAADIVMPGTKIGYLSKEIMDETNVSGMALVAVGSHDTASAVAATPLDSKNSAYLSCGTWSLLGAEVESPIISPESFAENFTNEGGVEGTIRFLKNINGLWIVQQLRKSFNEQTASKVGFPDIILAAQTAKKTHFEINPNDNRFISSLNMAREISDYCEENGQGRPDGLGEIAIAVYNGLTNEYKSNIEKLESLTGKKVDTLNMIGGGIQDSFLCSLTAKKICKKVVTGPQEGSVLGNIIMQLKALGAIKTLEEGRAIVKNSCEQKIY